MQFGSVAHYRKAQESDHRYRRQPHKNTLNTLYHTTIFCGKIRGIYNDKKSFFKIPERIHREG